MLRTRPTSPISLWSILQYPSRGRGDQYSDFDDGYGTSGPGGAPEQDPFDQGGYPSQDSYDQGGYGSQGNTNEGGYDQGNYGSGDYVAQGGHDQRGYQQSPGFDQGGYGADSQGPYDDGAYASGGQTPAQGADDSGRGADGTDPYGDPYYDSERYGGGRDPYYDGRKYGDGVGPYSPKGKGYKPPKKRPPYALIFGLVLLIVLPLLLVVFIAPSLVSLHDTRTIAGLQKFRYKFQSTTGAVAKEVTVEIVGGDVVDITLCRESDDSGDACSNPVAHSEAVSTFRSSRTLSTDHYVLIIENLAEDDVIAKFAVKREMF